MRRKLLILTIMLAASSTARAGFVDGNALLDRMDGDAAARLFALGYVAAIYDAGLGIKHCPPDNVTLKQANDVVRRILDRVPTIRDHTGDIVVAEVLARTWPCKKKSASL